jgi:acyl carrier protein
VRSRVKDVVARVLEIDPSAVPDDARTGELPGWDSLRQLELALELEREFDVRIATEAMLELTSLDAIEAFLSRAAPA